LVAVLLGSAGTDAKCESPKQTSSNEAFDGISFVGVPARTQQIEQTVC